MVGAFMEVLAEETDETPFVTPVNEISFIAWAGGDFAYINPFAKGRGYELKIQLIKAAIAAIESVWEVNPRSRIVQTDPVINVIADPEKPSRSRRGPSLSLISISSLGYVGRTFSPRTRRQGKISRFDIHPGVNARGFLRLTT